MEYRTFTSSNRAIAVNPQTVRRVEAITPHESLLIFSESDRIAVSGSLEDVIQHLRAGDVLPAPRTLRSAKVIPML